MSERPCNACGFSSLEEHNLYHKCTTCGLVMVTRPERPFKYDARYHDLLVAQERSQIAIRLNLVRLGLLARFHVGNSPSNDTGLVLDFGGGTGTFGVYARPYFDVLTYDLCYERLLPNAVGYNSRYPCRWGHGEGGRDYPNDVSTVTMFDSLEHVDDPKVELDALARYCNVKTFIITTPNLGIVVPSKVTEWKHFKPGEHHWLFTESSMRHLCPDGYHIAHVGTEEGDIRLDGMNNKAIMTLVMKRGPSLD